LSKALSILGVVAAVAFAVAPNFTSINPKIAAYLTLIGTAVSAASGALVRFGAGNRYLTAIGVAVAVLSVVAGAADLLPEQVVQVLTVVGTALAAIGKSLFGFEAEEGGNYQAAILLPLIGLLALGSASCDRSKQLAASTDRVAGYVAAGLAIVDRQTTTGEMTPETGIAIVTTLRVVNTLNANLITEGKKYLDNNGNLRLDGDGQQKLLAILATSQSTIQTLINDPRITKLSPESRAKWSALTNDLGQTISVIAELVKTAKVTRAK
jgi:hypothetical protein